MANRARACDNIQERWPQQQFKFRVGKIGD